MSDLETLRKSLFRRQMYMVFMHPPEPQADPLAYLKPKLKEHIEYLQQLEADGRLFASGALRDETGQWDGSGVAIVRAASIDAARQIAAEEPFAMAGLRKNTVTGWLLNEGNLTINVQLSARQFDLP